MTDSHAEPSERDLLTSMCQHVAAAEERARRERRIARRLSRNLRFERDPTGYAISDRTSTLCEAMGLSLDQAEAWANEHFSIRRRPA